VSDPRPLRGWSAEILRCRCAGEGILGRFVRSVFGAALLGGAQPLSDRSGLGGVVRVCDQGVDVSGVVDEARAVERGDASAHRAGRAGQHAGAFDVAMQRRDRAETFQAVCHAFLVTQPHRAFDGGSEHPLGLVDLTAEEQHPREMVCRDRARELVAAVRGRRGGAPEELGPSCDVAAEHRQAAECDQPERLTPSGASPTEAL
jgi:hypothetical protein